MPPVKVHSPGEAPAISDAVKVHNPWAPRDGAVVEAPKAKAPVEITAPPTTGSAPAAPAKAAAPAKPAEAAPVEDDDEEYGETVVVDRRPQVSWTLVLDDGPALRLTGAHVLLGRKPASTDADTQALAVPDKTRTLSKVHARLDLEDGVWKITDLNSTNGVLLVAEDGTETLVDPGNAVEVKGSFVLGKVAMSIRHED